MDLHRLRIFYEVATTGSFTRAAEQLYMTQPAVTQQVRALEDELGVRLFDRLGRRVRLTPAGQALLPYPPRLGALLDEGLLAAREAGGLATRTLGLGAGDTLATYLLPDLIRELTAERPEVALHLVVGNTERLVEALLENEVEVTIWARQDPHHLLVQHPFRTVPLVAVFRPDDPLARRSEIWAHELVGRRLLLRGRASAIRRFTDQVLQHGGIDTDQAVEMDHLEAIKRTVEVGYGDTVCPAFSVVREVQLGLLAAVPLADPGASLTLHYVHYAHRTLSPLGQAFVNLLLKPAAPALEDLASRNGTVAGSATRATT